MKKKLRKITRQMTYKLIHLRENSTETGGDMKNLVGYRVFTTNYYIPSFYMAWMEIYITIWLCHPNRLIT